ncbi:MAG TPA: hypothetical protein VJ021_04520 [Thermoplasmata archaeon]|nr:hypothetical protein [Thermoplasmata archaeon]
MRDQPKWAEHAAFVNALVREEFIVLAGPLGDGSVHRALLIVNSISEAAIRARFAEDPWIVSAILRTIKIDPWTILASDDRLDRALAEITDATS